MDNAPVYYDVFAVRMDRTGETLLIRGRDFFGGAGDFLWIYDREWNVRGSLPLTAYDYVLTPDGSRAITYGDDGKVHIYDLTAAPVSGLFPEIGSGITLVDSPTDAFANLVRMALTPDGQTLFVAGDKQIVIQPIP